MLGSSMGKFLWLACLLLVVQIVCAYGGGGGGGGGQGQHQHHYFTRQGVNQRRPAGFTKLFQWKQLDFKFPSPQIRQQAIRGKTFVEKNSAMPLSLQADETRLFVSVPRWRQGVPSTLNYLSLTATNETATSPQLVPYPNLNFNRQGNCEGVTSVFRMFADECHRLWVVDTGKVGAQQVCPPQVLAFDLKTDKVTYKHRFTQDALVCHSQPTNIAVDYSRGQCGQANKPDAFLYVTDTAANAIIVIDVAADKSWRVTHKSMHPAPEAATFNVAGQQFDLLDGVVGLTLSPVRNNNERDLYFNPMTSFNHFWVPTSILRNRNATSTIVRNFSSGLAKKSTQSAGCGMDARGVLFFGLLNQHAIACWDSKKSYEDKNHLVLAKSDSDMQFLSTVVVDPYDRVWALSTRFHRFYTNSMDPEEINFRVFSGSASELVRGTVCEPAATPASQRGRA